MDPMSHNINLFSRTYRESYTVNWSINGFNLMPFSENNSVCSPWFILGKNKDCPWSLSMTKEVHGGVKNLGFALKKTKHETKWGIVTFSLDLKTDDGWFVTCIENQVVGKESSNPYVFLVRPSESGMVSGPSEVVVCGSSEASENIPVHVGKVHDLMWLSEIKESESIENGCIMEGLSGIKARSTNYENGICSEELSGVKNAIKVENGCGLEGSSKVKSSTSVENGISSESFGVEESSHFEISSLKQLSASPLLEMPERPEQLSETILQNGHASELPVETMNFSTFDGLEKGRNLHVSTELPNSNAKDNKSDTQRLTPEELFQQENITVVCKIEYTYMCNPIPDEDGPDTSDLIDDFRDLYASGKFSDVTLKCEDVHFLCHKAILCSRSPLFRRFLDKEASCLVLKSNLVKEVSSNLVPDSYLDRQKASSDQVSIPNLVKEASSDLVPDSNLDKKASSGLVPIPSLVKEASSDLVPDSNLDKKASSDLVPIPNLVKEASSELVADSNLDKKASSYQVPMPNLVKEASPYLVPDSNLKEASSDLVLKLNLDLTSAKALLLYVYTGELDEDLIETKDECWRLLFAARKFGLPGLRKLCVAFLKEFPDEEECVIEKVYETKLDKKLSFSVCLEDDSKASVGEKAPATNISTQTSTSH